MAAAGSEMNLDIWKQVSQFLQGTSRPGPQVNFESLSTSAFFLLRTVPVARHAVLEHYANVFDDAVNTHLCSVDTGNRSMSVIQESQLTALQDVTGILLSFIHSNPEAWAPVVSTWSLTLLGQMSSKYGNKRGIHPVTPLNEILHLWMACPPAKMLVDMTTQCFAAMVGGAPDMCVDALLEASVRYSHFDWVVAHIGSCFPKTIITRVLNCGLKDFCNSSRPGTERDLAASRMKIPKMESVVGILGHLAAKHQQDIRKALMAMFQASLRPDQPAVQVTSVPFLLQLASMSPMLLTILTTDLISALTPSVLNQLHHQFTHWKRATPSEYTSFLNLVVHLIGKCHVGSFNIINFILNTASPTGGHQGEELPNEEVRDTCSEIVHILLFELQRGVLSKRKDCSHVEIPLLAGLSEQSDLLTSTLLSCDDKRAPWLLKLTTFTGLQASQDKAASMLAHVIFHAQTPKQLSVFYQLKQGLEIRFPSITKSALNHIFNKLNSSSPSGPETPSSSSPPLLSSSHVSSPPSLLSWYRRALRNMEKVLAVEDAKVKKKLASGSLIIDCMRQRHAAMCEFALSDDPDICISVLRLMSIVGFPNDLSTSQLTKLCGAVALAFMSSLHWSSQKQEARWARMTRLCMSCLEQLSSLPFTKSLLIHYLIDGAVAKTNFKLFGGKDISSTSAPVATGLSTRNSMPSLSTPLGMASGDHVSLLEENSQQRLSIALPRSHSSVFHGGIIRRGAKALSGKEQISQDAISRNCTTLIETLWHCCREPVRKQSASGAVKDEPMETDEPCSSTRPLSTPPATSLSSSSWSISESAARTLGCVLVDVLTLDSLYNDVLWPDPDFRKVTTERDTVVWRRLEEMSFLWDIIEEYSTSCVFLYYLSPVLRSIMAAIMNWLEVSRSSSLADCPKHHQAAVRLLACLTKGQLLPSPLSNVSELFPFVSPYEGYLLLLSIWQYLKENPPSEYETDVKSRACNNSHTQVASSIIHANIHNIAHLSPRILQI